MRVTWDDVRPYSQGVSQGMLYPENAPGVAWNGLISVTEKGDDSPDTQYVDGQKYRNKAALAFFEGTITAFTYPDEFEPYVGLVAGQSSQPRPAFGFSYRNNKEIHLVYNALASLSSNQFSSVSDQADANAFSWDFTTLPVKIPGGRPTAHLVILTDYSQSGAISQLEAVLYGDVNNDPSLPDPADVIDIFESNAVVRITDNGDGTWTASGPAVTMLDANTFQIDWPSAVYIPSDYVDSGISGNWTFETGVTGWSFFGSGGAAGTVTQSTAWSNGAGHSALITITTHGTGTNEAIADITTPIVDDILTVKVTLHAAAALNGISLGVDWKTSAHVLISQVTKVSGINLAAGETRTIVYTLDPAPATTGIATLKFALAPGAAAGATLAFDDVSYSIQRKSGTYKISSL